MRYYEISLAATSGTNLPTLFSSHPNGQYDPGALNVMFDMPILAYDTPAGGQTIQIEGIPLSSLSQAKQYAGMNVIVKGGMKKGLPLANPAQSGVLTAGQVFQSWGNWQGTEMVLNLMLMPSNFTMDAPGNFMFTWLAGQSLSDALKSMFSIVFPNYPVSINVGSNIVLNHDYVDRKSTLEGIAMALGDTTEKIFKQRVTITMQGGRIVVYDATYKPSPIQIAFTDLIGQPTWLEQKTMQLQTVMRADLQVGSLITMPKDFKNAPGFIATMGSSLPSSNKYESAFQNNFTVTEIRHIGNYRSPDGTTWATVINCLTNS